MQWKSPSLLAPPLASTKSTSIPTSDRAAVGTTWSFSPWVNSPWSTIRLAAWVTQLTQAPWFFLAAPLLGDDCARCPDYEGIERLGADLRRYGLDRFARDEDRGRVAARGG